MLDRRWRMRLLTLGALAAVLGPACADRSVSRAEAQALILRSEEFGRVRTASLYLYWGPDHHLPADPALKAVIEKLGWVLPGDPSTPRSRPKLSPAFASRLKQNYTISFPTGEYKWPYFNNLVFDAAKRQFITVSGITTGETQHSAVAEFQWKWDLVGVAKELVEAGWSGERTLPLPDDVYTGQAAFRLFDDGWRLEQIQFIKGGIF